MMERTDRIRIYYCRNTVGGGRLPEGLANLQLRDDVTVEAVPCGGRIDPRYLLKAFESGADAVCVLTCPINHCKLMEGNLRAAVRIDLAREILSEVGLGSGCIQMFIPSDSGEAALDVAIENMVRFVDDRSRARVGVMA
ncbi:MAG: hydrogenase iron-sulfur subunit [Armatimonadetes bacterium]|nr:hydrogenase iron-sulfur subunit [Armatimonadota bacterium]